MAQATNVSTIILSRFHNFADPALADALGHADAVLKGPEPATSCSRMNLSAGASSSWRPIHGDSRRADRWSPRYQGREGIRHGLRMYTPSPTALRLKYGASGKITFAGAAGIAARQSMGLQRHRGWLWRPRSVRSDGCQLWRAHHARLRQKRQHSR
jgi:hypothetical protein